MFGTKEIFPTVGDVGSLWMVGFNKEAEQVLRFGNTQFPNSGLAVRGGKPAPFYAQKLAEAKAVDTQVQAAKAAKAQAKQQEEAELARKTQELRKSVKPGDRIAQGLVLAVNGDLVKVQTYARECEIYRSVRNHSSGKFDCERYHVVVAGEQWVRRDEIRPIVPVKFE